MFTDLTHNKIISDTMTERFLCSFNTDLIPLVEGVFTESLVGVQMYEDYLSCEFKSDGRWHYPLTVLTDEGARTLWISWSVDKKRFKGAVPYSYVGDGPIDFLVADDVPAEFKAELEGRSIYAPGGYIKVQIHSVSDDPLFLAGKYSQTFIDEMARQLTDEISKTSAVRGLGDAPLTLQMIFAPDTYMEHTSENVTYRRLRLTNKTSAPRDFWIKWTRSDSSAAYSVSDAPRPGTITFQLGEDVSKKIREKEYRFLLRQSTDKYHTAMSRKNVTDWRELVKRSKKRGELQKIEIDEAVENILPEEDDTLKALLESIATTSAPAPRLEEEVEKNDNSLDEALRRLLAESESYIEPKDEPALDEEVKEEDEPDLDEENKEEDEPLAQDGETEITEPFERFETYEEAMEQTVESTPGLTLGETVTVDDWSEEQSIATDEMDEKVETAAISYEEREEKLRAEIEAKIRLEYETIARQRAEDEARKLLEEQKRLRRENERLVEEARRIQEIRDKEDAERREREERMRAELEAKEREEAREKARLQAAAMLALEEKRRLESERAQAEHRLQQEAKRYEEERLLALERAKIEEERRQEAERIRRTMEAEAQANTPNVKNVRGGYTFTTRRVFFFFRSDVDYHITEPMERIIRATLEKAGKTNVPINIKASLTDERTVCLDFLKLPEEEEGLFIDIVKAIGNANLGITRARVEK